MALSDATIRRLTVIGELGIDPFDDSKLQPAGYDLRSAEEIILRPKEQRLGATLEHIKLSPSLLGILHLKSSFVREGIFASLALVDPGFIGQLTVSLLNAGDEVVEIERGEPFLQLTFIRLTSKAQRPYAGKYQESIGVIESKRTDRVKKLANGA
jgi:deoxycytidine triphosphate deaminase